MEHDIGNGAGSDQGNANVRGNANDNYEANNVSNNGKAKVIIAGAKRKSVKEMDPEEREKKREVDRNAATKTRLKRKANSADLAAYAAENGVLRAQVAEYHRQNQDLQDLLWRAGINPSQVAPRGTISREPALQDVNGNAINQVCPFSQNQLGISHHQRVSPANLMAGGKASGGCNYMPGFPHKEPTPLMRIDPLSAATHQSSPATPFGQPAAAMTAGGAQSSSAKLFGQPAPSMPSTQPAPAMHFDQPAPAMPSTQQPPAMPYDQPAPAMHFDQPAPAMPSTQQPPAMPYGQSAPAMHFDQPAPTMPSTQQPPDMPYGQSAPAMHFDQPAPTMPSTQQPPAMPYDQPAPTMPSTQQSPSMPYDQPAPAMHFDQPAPTMPSTQQPPAMKKKNTGGLLQALIAHENQMANPTRIMPSAQSSAMAYYNGNGMQGMQGMQGMNTSQGNHMVTTAAGEQAGLGHTSMGGMPYSTEDVDMFGNDLGGWPSRMYRLQIADMEMKTNQKIDGAQFFAQGQINM
ncbi:hypothetical protein NHQ30_005973 [Ciborinia camelliae]|nr:hypothetical protein NHQ30_005973 [Ciborinia camelliae]